jgi:periplasmic protein CpxP/Spy
MARIDRPIHDKLNAIKWLLVARFKPGRDRSGCREPPTFSARLYITLQRPRRAETRLLHIVLIAATATLNKEHDTMSQTSPNEGMQPPSVRPPRRRRWLAILLIGVAGLFGFAAGKVHSSPWLHFWGHHHQFDAEEITFFVQHRIGRALSRVDATQEQRDKIDAIAKAAINDVVAMRKDPAARRDKVLAIFKADTIDRSALETIRAEQLGIGEAASKRIVQAIADAAEVLKPEQRRQLADDWQRWHMLP